MSSHHSVRRGPVPWRSFVKVISIVGASVLLATLLLTLIGFELHIPFLVIFSISVAAAIWLGSRVVDPAPTVPDQRPVLDVVHLQSRNADRRVRKLEEFLYGAQPRFNLASGELRGAIRELVDERLESRTEPAVLSDDLSSYLSADPAPPVDRNAIRSMIKEIASL